MKKKKSLKVSREGGGVAQINYNKNIFAFLFYERSPFTRIAVRTAAYPAVQMYRIYTLRPLLPKEYLNFVGEESNRIGVLAIRFVSHSSVPLNMKKSFNVVLYKCT